MTNNFSPLAGEDETGSLPDVRDELNEIKEQISALTQMFLNSQGNTGQLGRQSARATSAEEIAAEAQALEPFDPDNCYDTLIDPQPRTKKELCDYVDEAVDFYGTGDLSDVGEMFFCDFRHWNESHFSSLNKKTLVALRDVLLSKGLQIKKGSGFSMAKALMGFLETFKAGLPEIIPALDVSSGVGATTQPPSPSFVLVPRPTETMATRTGSPQDAHRSAIRNTPISHNDSHGSPRSRPRPSDVAKLFPKEMRYSGAPSEPLRRMYATFVDACELAGIEPDNSFLLLRLMQNVFLKDAALVYYMDRLKDSCKSADEAIENLEKHFLGQRAKRVNDEVWHELSFQFVKQSREMKGISISNDEVLNDLFVQITNLSDMRTGPGSDDIVCGKIISSVREVRIFAVVCQNPPEDLQSLMAVLRSCALEADRATIRSGNASTAFNTNPDDDETSLLDSLGYYVDRQLHNRRKDAPLRGYGKGPGRRPRRFRPKRFVPPDVCIICHKKGCHSSKHRNRTSALLAHVAQVLVADADGDDSTSSSENDNDATESDTEDENHASGNLAVAYHVSAVRSMACLGIRRDHKSFVIDGAVLDTGSSKYSTIGNALVRGAQAASAIPTNPNYHAMKCRIGGIGDAPHVETMGCLKFGFMFGGQIYEIDLYILPGSTPILISHKDLDNMGLNYQTMYKSVTRLSDGFTEPVLMRSGLPFLIFCHQSFFTAAELQSMHRNLGHPSVDKHMKIIESAQIDDLPRGTRKQIDELVRYCKACQYGRMKPRRFLFSVKDPCTGEFNNVVELDVMKLSDGYVLHVLCTGTLFQQGCFLRNMSAAEAWKSLRRCWINIYAGAPDILVHDQGSNFTAAEFGEAADELGIIMKGIPTEAHERIGAVERRHAVVRSVYEKLKTDLPKTSAADRLSLTFRAINDVPDSDSGICPTTMVFGVYPKIPRSGHRGSMAVRAKIIQDCTALATKMKARRVIKDSVRKYHAPSMREIEKLRRLPPGSDVLVHREKIGWKKYSLSSVKDNEVQVVLPSGKISSFGIHCVRQFHDQEELEPVTNTDTPRQPRESISLLSICEDGVQAFVGQEKSREDFSESRLDELRGLESMGTFEVAAREEAKGHRLYNSLFVDSVKETGKKKSRFCVAAFNDDEHRLFTAAPTVKRSSLRILVALCAMYELPLHTRDVTKAFLQSTTVLRRPVFVRPPKEMGIDDAVLKIIRPLYGMPESPIHWFNTYLNYHKEKLGMSGVPMDPCLLYSISAENNSPNGLVGLQVDDTLFGGTSAFLEEEQTSSAAFPNTGKTEIGTSIVKFNGLDISKIPNGYRMSQEKYICDIPTMPKAYGASFDVFRSTKAKYAYGAYSTLPEVLIHVSKLSQVTPKIFEAEKSESLKLLQKLIQIVSPSNGHFGLSFIKINPNKAEVFVCFDAAFATNRDHSSQLGVVVMLRDKTTGDCNIVHFVSMKSKRVCRSVLSAELFALIEGFDLGFTIRDTMQRCTGRRHVNLTLATDSRSLFSLSVTLAQTTEKRLLIDLSLIREAYEKRDINDFVWISGDCNPADGLTKVSKRNNSLAEVISSNKFLPKAESWIERDEIFNISSGGKRTSDKIEVPAVSHES